MAADSERLDERELIEREVGSFVEFSRRHHDLLSHTAVHVHPEYAELWAAVRPSATACRAFLAIDVRLDRAQVPRADTRDTGPDRDDLDAELVPKDPRIGKEGLPASERMQVGSANAHPAHPHERLSRERCRGRRHIDLHKPPWLIESYGFHAICAGATTQSRSRSSTGRSFIARS